MWQVQRSIISGDSPVGAHGVSTTRPGIPPRSLAVNAARASASEYTAPTRGVIAPRSTSTAISASCAPLGSRTNETVRMSSAGRLR